MHAVDLPLASLGAAIGRVRRLACVAVLLAAFPAGAAGTDEASTESGATAEPEVITAKKPKEDDPPKKKGPREFTMADLPKQCKGVLAAD